MNASLNKFKSCSFFGHRKIEISNQLVEKLTKTIEELIVKNNVTTFLFGSRSEFNDLCYKIVTDLKIKYSSVKRIAYTCQSETCTLENEKEKQEKIYFSVCKKNIKIFGFEEEYHHKTKYIAGKASYVERNQEMINHSDYCIFYYDLNYKPPIRKYSKRNAAYYQPKSGTAIAYDFAKQKKRFLINIFDFNKKN